MGLKCAPRRPPHASSLIESVAANFFHLFDANSFFLSSLGQPNLTSWTNHWTNAITGDYENKIGNACIKCTFGGGGIRKVDRRGRRSSRTARGDLAVATAQRRRRAAMLRATAISAVASGSVPCDLVVSTPLRPPQSSWRRRKGGVSR
uniref:Uncharacterized protein n=1 Tax=Plectus sambesii TaxID=2011161 RepID=A0A914X0D9_9BILA